MKTRFEVLAVLQAVANEVLGPDAPELSETMSLNEDTIDSLDLAEMVIILEDKTGVILDVELVEEVTELGQLVDIVVQEHAKSDVGG